MKERERDRLIELTERAISINEKLLAKEKYFVEAVNLGTTPLSLKELNETLAELSRKELLYLSASKSLLQIINKE